MSPRVATFLLLGLASVLAGCASMESAPPERLAELQSKTQACGAALPDISEYDVDRFGRVRASAQGPEASLVEQNFYDCVAARGRWTTWTAGQPPPMLEPIGTENPDSSAHIP